jgi:kelch-like protein 17 (actinfilin)
MCYYIPEDDILPNLHVLVSRYDGASDLTSAESYSPMLNKWSSITPMGTKRSCLGTCSFAGLLYACGGYDGASCLSSMERYDPLTGVWTSCPAMGTRRRYCRIAVVGKQLPVPALMGTNEYVYRNVA